MSLKASITHDLEEMKAKGFGGAVLIDAGGAARTAMPKCRTARIFFRLHGVSFTNTRCAKPTGSAWKSA